MIIGAVLAITVLISGTAIAATSENGALDKFKQERLQNRNAAVDQAVKDGKISKENAEALKKAFEERIQNCTGTPGTNGQGLGCGAGLGGGCQGAGMGQGLGCGQGRNFNNK